MMMLGAAIAAIAPLGAGISVVRLANAQRVLAGRARERRIATFGYTYSMLLFAVVGAVGLCLLVFGGVVGYGLPGWAPALPAGLLAVASLGAAYARWLVMRERGSP
jgi:hypothetical protein